jgi:hypothetical protein
MSLLAPGALLFALAALLPLGALALLERRARRIRRVLGEPEPRLRSLAPAAACLITVPVLLAVAVAEPVVEQKGTRVERLGVQAYVVLDTSGSMRASSGPRSPTRLDRAKAEALELRRALPDIRFGIATLTDRVLPTIFPTGDPAVFEGAMAQSIAVEKPPPGVLTIRATALGGLSELGRSGFYTAPRRLAVVFTDGETTPVPGTLAKALRRGRVSVLFVHVWRPGERIYTAGTFDPVYRTDPRSTGLLERAATMTGGRVFGEGDTGALVAAARARLAAPGTAATVRAKEVRRVPVAKWFVLAAIVPLAFLLWRRNVPLGWRWQRRASLET